MGEVYDGGFASWVKVVSVKEHKSYVEIRFDELEEFLPLGASSLEGNIVLDRLLQADRVAKLRFFDFLLWGNPPKKKTVYTLCEMVLRRRGTGTSFRFYHFTLH